MVLRRRLVLGSIAIASVVLSACGVTGDAGGATVASVGGSSASARLARSAETTSAVDTVRFTVETEVSGVANADELSLTSTGVLDLANGRGEVSADMASLLSGDADATFTVILDGDSVYLQAPILSELAGSKPWIAMTSDRLGDVTGDAGADDPLALLDHLEDAGIEVTEVGREDVRGTPTTHYTTDAPIEVWIDEDDHVRRLIVTTDGSKLGKRDDRLEGASVTQTMELYDFDEPVDIVVPDPSEVSTFDLQGAFSD